MDKKQRFGPERRLRMGEKNSFIHILWIKYSPWAKALKKFLPIGFEADTLNARTRQYQNERDPRVASTHPWNIQIQL